ncbi:MAG: dihydroorotate dehydrogenase electron transfer subunit [Candidatus Firestonebacteria bacterium]
MMFTTKVLENKEITASLYYLKLQVPDKFNAMPGQFVMLKINDSFDPILRRPFSISGFSKNRIEILYKVIGKGTKLISHKKVGDEVNIIGPLGNNFNIDNSKIPVLIAGGYGVAPLLFLAKNIRKYSKNKKIVFLFGAKSKKDIMLRKEFKKYAITLNVATEIGGTGYKGLITDLLKYLLDNKTLLPEKIKIYACGPEKMIKEISKIASQTNISCEVSLEALMGCGIGVCLTCVCATKFGLYKHICIDGPIFDSTIIKL